MTQTDRWEALDRGMDDMIAAVLAMPEEKRHTPAVKGAFTPAQTLEHMALCEAYYLPMIRTTAAKGLQGKPSRTSFLFPFVVRKLASAQPVPTTKAMDTHEERPDADRAADHWRMERKKLKEATADVDDEDTVMKHPLFGLMSPLDIVEINIAHLVYHSKRI